MLYAFRDRERAKALREHLEAEGVSSWYIEAWGYYIVTAPSSAKVKPPVKADVEVDMRGEYQLVSRAWKRDPTPVRIGDREISEGKVFIIAGPCSVESRDQILSAAKAVKEMGAHALRPRP